MRTILFYYPGLDSDQLFNENARDGVTEPYIHLRNKLRKLGFHLTTDSSVPASQIHDVWYWDVPSLLPSSPLAQLSRIWTQLRKRKDTERVKKVIELRKRFPGCALFLGEPPTVSPQNYVSNLHNGYRAIFTWDDQWVDGKLYHKFRLPLPSTYPRLPGLPFRERKLLVNVSANKHSNHPLELYSARRTTIKYFEQFCSDDFDLFGFGWNKSRDKDVFVSYRGSIDQKWRVFPMYRFGLTYENIQGIPGYVTEKIFDCMRCGTVPIYWGAPNISQYVDEEAFIDRRNFASDADLAKFISSMTEKEHQNYVDAGQAYINSDRFALFLPDAFAENIIGVLGLDE